jgi:hypothetical protein
MCDFIALKKFAPNCDTQLGANWFNEPCKYSDRFVSHNDTATLRFYFSPNQFFVSSCEMVENFVLLLKSQIVHRKSSLFFAS